MTSKWVSVDDIGLGDVFETLHSGLTVSLIATLRDQLMTCIPDEPITDAMSRNAERYNHLPVTKGLCRNNRSIFSIPGWMDGVVPVSVKGVTFQVDLGHLFIAEGDALGIRPLVDFGSDTQSGFRGR